jgi:hypothetical protein
MTLKGIALVMVLALLLAYPGGAAAKFGNWLDLDAGGSSGYVTTAGGPSEPTEFDADLGNTFTIEAWINLEGASIAGSGAHFVAKWGTTTAFQSYRLTEDGTGGLLFQYRIAGVGAPSTSGGTLPTTGWVHIVAVHDGTQFQTAINGTWVGSATSATGVVQDTNAPLRIGGDSAGPPTAGTYYDGWIDEVRISNAAFFTPIGTNFTPPTVPYTSLASTQGLWHFDEAVGSTGPFVNQVTTTPTSDFALGANAQTLPVELSSFTVAAGDGQVTLRWVTESEVNNLGFNLYRAEQREGIIGEYVQINDALIPGMVNTSTQQSYEFVDHTIPHDGTYWYQLEDVDFDGLNALHDPISIIVLAQSVPEAYTLHQNHPNPFNPVTTISYELPEAGDVRLSILTIAGQEIATVVSGYQEVGHHRVTWDGRDDQGHAVGNGVYLYRMVADGHHAVRKMLLVR